MIITSDYGSFPHSLLSTSKWMHRQCLNLWISKGSRSTQVVWHWGYIGYVQHGLSAISPSCRLKTVSQKMKLWFRDQIGGTSNGFHVSAILFRNGLRLKLPSGNWTYMGKKRIFHWLIYGQQAFQRYVTWLKLPENISQSCPIFIGL